MQGKEWDLSAFAFHCNYGIRYLNVATESFNLQWVLMHLLGGIPHLTDGSGFSCKTKIVWVNLSSIMSELLQRYHRLVDGEALGGDQGGRVEKSRVNACPKYFISHLIQSVGQSHKLLVGVKRNFVIT